MLVFRLYIRRSVYARPPPLSRRICEIFKRRKQQQKNWEKQILTGRAIEKKNKWNYGREGLWPSFYMTVAKLFYDPCEREEEEETARCAISMAT